MAEESTLIVDVDRKVCELILALLKQMGESGVCTESGAAALQYLQTHIPRLVLIDVGITDMPWLDLLKTIRQEPKFALTPVILANVNPNTPEFETQAKDQGATEYWIKSNLLFANFKTLVAPYLTRTTLSSRDRPKHPSSKKSKGSQHLN